MKGDFFNKRKIFFFLSLLFLVFALPAALLLTQKQQRYEGRAFNNEPPKSIHVSNVNSKGFTVSWITQEQTSGAVLFYGTQSNSTPILIGDIRDSTPLANGYKTHYIKIYDGVGLSSKASVKANQIYYFKILSGGNAITNQYGIKTGTGEKEVYLDTDILTQGFPFSVTTLLDMGNENNPTSENSPGAYSKEKLQTREIRINSCRTLYPAFVPCPDGRNDITTNCCYRPNPIYGKVIGLDGKTPVGGAIVYTYIRNKTRIMSALTDSTNALKGTWVMDLANLINMTDNKYFGYTPGVDYLVIESELEPAYKISKEPIDIPEVINSACFANKTAIMYCNANPNTPYNINPAVISFQSLLSGNCQCDLGNITNNSCSKAYTPKCAGKFGCECISNISPIIKTNRLVSGTRGRTYQATIEGEDNNADDILSMSLNGLPRGTYLQKCTQNKTVIKKIICQIGGMPTNIGRYKVKISLTDRNSWATKTLDLVVY